MITSPPLLVPSVATLPEPAGSVEPIADIAFGSALTALTYYRGRVALAAILKALEIGRGDEVVVQAFTCVAVPEGVSAAGAVPVYADIEADGLNMCPASLETRLSPNTRAIVVQHTFGVPANLSRITEIARRAGVPIIEDCCHAFGSTYRQQPLGSFGIASFYSFEWGKPVVAGLGGAAIANDRKLHEKLVEQYADYQQPSWGKRLQLEVQYRAFSALYRPQWYWQVRDAFHRLSRAGAAAGNFHEQSPHEPSPEFSLRMSAHMARRARSEARRLATIRSQALEVTDRYRRSIRYGQHPVLPSSSTVCYARYPLRVPCKQQLLASAREQRIELADWYRTAVHPLDGEQLRTVHYRVGSCPHAETRASEIVSLPTNGRVDAAFVDRAVRFLNEQQ